MCYLYLRKQGQSKFNTKTYPCVFIGYSPLYKGYICLNNSSKRVYISRHVVFDELVFPFAAGNSHDISKLQDSLPLSTFADMDEWCEHHQTKDPQTTLIILTCDNAQVISNSSNFCLNIPSLQKKGTFCDRSKFVIRRSICEGIITKTTLCDRN